ncbi:MAG TPA: phenylalanine--tRNA ligase subunit beta [Candidatus Acidoferrales bacterium]
MKILYNWLKDFVDFTAAPEELRTRLAMSGTQVDAIEDSPEGPVLDVELFMNRPDCMGHYGIAREVAALYRTRLKPVRPKLSESKDRAESATRVDIECPDLCGRFTARVVRGVKVQPSPEWLRKRLEALGAASINNVVDATNYVMFELGHPLHAFDMDTLAERRIVVRRAKKGEKFRTLDGVERTLGAGMCLVGDAARHTGIGGVMGGAETEISFSTKNVLLECAWFDPISIRRTAKALGLRTEASTRFERGMDPEMADLASRRCAELIQQLAGGEVLAGVVDAYPARHDLGAIPLTRTELLRVMGADVPDAEIEAILTALGFEPQRTDGNQSRAGSLVATWECRHVPWRHDVTREIDLVEEIARHYGFDKFPARMPVARQPAARLPHAAADDALRERLVALGYHECVSIPLVDPRDDARFRAAGVQELVIGNPLAEDAAVLRSSGIVSMLHTLEWNINRGQRNVRLFEIGRKYEARGKEIVETPVLTLGATGLARQKSVHEDAREFTLAALKGDMDALGAQAGGVNWQAGGPEWLHAARAARVLLDGKEIGFGGQLARKTAEQLKLRQDAFVAELLLEPLRAGYDAAKKAVRARPLPRFPAVERDFSLLLPDGATFAQVADAVRGLGIAELESVAAVDLYRGKNVPEGKYSLLVRVVFQSHETTLTDDQVNDYAQRIVAALEKSLGASLRTS